MSFCAKLLLFKAITYILGNIALFGLANKYSPTILLAIIWLLQKPRIIHRHLAPLFFTEFQCTNGACQYITDLVQRYSHGEYHHNQPEHAFRVYVNGKEIGTIECPKEDCKTTNRIQRWSGTSLAHFKIIGNALARAADEHREHWLVIGYKLLRYGRKQALGTPYPLGTDRDDRPNWKKRILRRLLGQPQKRIVSIPEKIDLVHEFIVGKSGAGKSQQLTKRMEWILANGYGATVIDPAGDTIDDILKIIPKSRRDDVLLIRPRDRDCPFELNVLDAKDVMAKLNLRAELLQAIKAVSDSWGGDIKANIGRAIEIVELMGGSLKDVFDLLTKPSARSQAIAAISDEELREFLIGWGKMSLKQQSPTVLKIRGLVKHPILGPMLQARESNFDAEAVIRESKIVLVDLDTASDADDVKILLGTIIIGKIRGAAIRQKKQDRKRHFLIIDEASDFMHPAMNLGKILSQARKQKLTLIMATQFLDQLGKLIKAVFGNCGTQISFEVDRDDADIFAKRMGDVTADEIIMQQPGQCIARIGQRTYRVKTELPDIPEEDHTKYIEARMRAMNKTNSAKERASHDLLGKQLTRSVTKPVVIEGVK